VVLVQSHTSHHPAVDVLKLYWYKMLDGTGHSKGVLAMSRS
jgi:hypothetical protein